MIAVSIVLILLSLLVATDPEHAGSSPHPAPGSPLRPVRKRDPEQTAKSDRLAA